MLRVARGILLRPSFSTASTSKPLKPPTLLLSEVFASVQGEGPFTGRPSVFTRLGVCNLSCAWCDTPYTWLFDRDRHRKVAARAGPHAQPRIYDKRTELTRTTTDHLFRDVRALAGEGIRAVVITGGEPLLQKKHLQAFVTRLIDDGFAIEFETNGTVSPEGLPRGVHLNVSPKLENSMQPVEQRIKLQVLKECLAWPNSVLKFVVGEHRDLDEVCGIVEQLDIPSHRVFLMPLGTDSETIRENGRWLTDVCQKHGFNYSHRVHVELWGDRRGV